jgi:large subunit ribosomal protein L22
MPGTKTNERPGTRAQVRYLRVSPSKAREVLDLIRGLPVDRADEILQFTERAVATDIRKVLASAVANAGHNDQITDDSVLYVSACYADEGPTLKRWRPRARGRATRIRKRTCHITIIVSVMPAEMLAKVEAERASSGASRATAPRRGRTAKDVRRARVAKSRAAQGLPEDEHDHDHDHEDHDHDHDLDDEVEAADVDDATDDVAVEDAEGVDVRDAVIEVEAEEADTTEDAEDKEEK